MTVEEFDQLERRLRDAYTARCDIACIEDTLKSGGTGLSLKATGLQQVITIEELWPAIKHILENKLAQSKSKLEAL